MKITLSKKQWQNIGEQAGWMNKSASSNNWIITKDHISYDQNDVGTGNPNILNAPDKIPFKMYDDDNELYYEGFMVSDMGESLFNPLDDFGMPNAGCTKIEIFNNGKWEVV